MATNSNDLQWVEVLLNTNHGAEYHFYTLPEPRWFEKTVTIYAGKDRFGFPRYWEFQLWFILLIAALMLGSFIAGWFVSALRHGRREREYQL